jgi:RNA polymerase sigma factor for flagellar operon FliA
MHAIATEFTAADRNALIAEHVPMARRLARKIARRVPRSFGREDLESAALLGLTEAAQRFDAGRGEPFVAFAAKRVRGAVLDELRRRDVLTRRSRQAVRQLAEVSREIEARVGREATTEELAATLGVSADQVVETQASAQAPTMVELDDVRDTSAAAEPAPSMDEALDLRRNAEALRAVLPTLPERELMVLSMYYEDGLTQKEIGDILGVSESRVCQLRTRAIATLRAALAK